MDTLIWVLAVLVVLASLYALVRVAMALWRHTTKLGRTVTEAADRVSAATADLQGLAEQMEAQRRHSEEPAAPRAADFGGSRR